MFSKTTHNRLRWVIATIVCLWTIFEAMTLQYSMLITWGAAEFFSPDAPHMDQCATAFYNLFVVVPGDVYYLLRVAHWRVRRYIRR